MEQSVSRDLEVPQILHLARKTLKIIITNVFKNLQEQIGEDKVNFRRDENLKRGGGTK